MSEVLQGHIVEERHLTQFTREARQNLVKTGHFKALGQAIAGRSIVSETKLLEAAEEIAFETKVAKGELERLLAPTSQGRTGARDRAAAGPQEQPLGGIS